MIEVVSQDVPYGKDPVVKRLGRGAYGEVHVAVDIRTGQKIVLKRMDKKNTYLLYLQHELR